MLWNKVFQLVVRGVYEKEVSGKLGTKYFLEVKVSK